MKNSFLAAALLIASTLHAQPTRMQLPNGWYLTPAGSGLPLSSDLPLNIALAPDGIHAAITDNGDGRQAIDLIDLRTRRITSSVTMGRSWFGLISHSPIWAQSAIFVLEDDAQDGPDHVDAHRSLPAEVDLNIRNTADGPSADLSHHFDLSDADRIPDRLMNAVLWHAIKGEESPVPQPRHSAFVRETR
jgi:hypothetical protein